MKKWLIVNCILFNSSQKYYSVLLYFNIQKSNDSGRFCSGILLFSLLLPISNLNIQRASNRTFNFIYRLFYRLYVRSGKHSYYLLQKPCLNYWTLISLTISKNYNVYLFTCWSIVMLTYMYYLIRHKKEICPWLIKKIMTW